MLLDDGTGSVLEGGGTGEAEAPVTYLGGEPTVHAFSPERVEQAMRFEYRADASGVTFALVVSGEALKSPALILTVARQVAATVNADAAVAGVADMQENQRVSALGSIDDYWDVAITSPSGLTTQVFQFEQSSMRADVFAQTVGAYRNQLAAFEG